MPESVFADDFQFKGSITTKGDIKLNGVVDGDVSARRVLIKENAEIRGSVTGERVVVGGTVAGNVDSVRLDLTSSANVQGDVDCKTLLADEESNFGQCSTHTEDPLKDGNKKSK